MSRTRIGRQGEAKKDVLAPHCGDVQYMISLRMHFDSGIDVCTLNAPPQVGQLITILRFSCISHVHHLNVSHKQSSA
ncbi:hypothetical protein, partial [uncultured Vibrio sp.]|uniref:hypothetical protein n=1 Tax=uncultured Vibrio sp. TaxID=114054 RepID=UPI0026317C21